MILATHFAVHDTGQDRLEPAPLHRAVCAALLPWLSTDGGLVLEGSVLRHAGRMRVFATLVDRQTHRVRHAFRYDGDAADEVGCGAFAAALAGSLARAGLALTAQGSAEPG